MSSGVLSGAVRDLIRRHAAAGKQDGSFDAALWRSLGQMGVLGLATPEGGGTAADLCQCILELGAAATAGPIVETVIAGQLDLGPDAAAVLSGEQLATVTWYPDLVPWGGLARIIFCVRGELAFRAEIADSRPVSTLAGDPWAGGELSLGAPAGLVSTGATLGQLAAAAYVTGAGLQIVALSAAYAAQRQQFGRPIGDYQAVSQPVAEAYARLSGLQDLLGGDALADADPALPETAERAARLRLLAARAAARATYAGCQIQGGMGFVDGTELARLGKRIRQVSLAGLPWPDSVTGAVSELAA